MKPIDRWEAEFFLGQIENFWRDTQALVEAEHYVLAARRVQDVMEKLKQVATFTAQRRAFLVLAIASRLKPTDPKAQREFWDTLAFEAGVRFQELEESHGRGESLAHRQWVRGPLEPQSP